MAATVGKDTGRLYAFSFTTRPTENEAPGSTY